MILRSNKQTMASNLHPFDLGEKIFEGHNLIGASLTLALLLILGFIWLNKRSKEKHQVPLPPGPRGLPIIGNLPFLDPNLHSCFADLSKIYGPIMKVRLGRRLCIIITSPSGAREVFKDHDTIFANHDRSIVGVAATYGGVDIAFAPHGDHWRMVRKVCVRDMLNNTKLDELYELRRREVREMVHETYTNIGTAVDIGELMLQTTFSVVTSMLWGDTIKGEKRKHVVAESRQVMAKVSELFAQTNFAEFFPAIARFDIQQIERRMKKVLSWFDKIFDSIIDLRLEMEKMEGEGGLCNDFLQVLLKLRDPADPKKPFNRTYLKAMLLDMILAGTKTVSTSMEWAMAELIKNPKVMKKAQEELKQVVGMNKVIEEYHLPDLPYLRAVVKEAIRLHTSIPLLIPRCPSQSCIVGGYMIPKGSMIFVNAWAIHRDPKYWKNPLEFSPERFLETSEEFDYSGNDFRFIPLGSGRRVCVGVPLAERMLPHILGSLLHSFEWKMPDGTKLDMSEMFGLELRLTKPLMAVPLPRLSDPKLYD
ncbi:geraniol 8-hydroxylase-like isoform X1 [Macadamia integrifolia]|uniref:geraniol 8-hydroxylase-like isoform X1 n=1 Tax=Macadamia integrifolia TaxID=60698 RepID=UPI001C4FDE1E|nr:geraniol 8-hydroxylase-like isoform X1 [Macadamia integrifolia]